MNNDDELKRRVSKQVARMQQADKDRPTLLAQTAYLGTLGLLFVVPVILGAYLGRWLDGLVEGYSLRWTLSLIMLGVGVGAMNVYLFIKE
ncbi:MAG: F0F1 ATP synthase subunit [Nitrospira sp. WS110]|nr:F0F1 ATP synthase subunit [Nitrospira sp. WS110]